MEHPTIPIADFSHLPPEGMEDIYRKLGIRPIPFRTSLSLAALIRYLEACPEGEPTGQTFLLREIKRRLGKAPALREPVPDIRALDLHKELFELLLSSILPPALRENQLAKLAAPFDLNDFYITPGLRNLIKENEVDFQVDNSKELMYDKLVIGACSLILNEYYGQQIQVEPPMMLTIKPPGSDMRRHFKIRMDFQFVDIKMLKPLAPLSQEQIHHLLSNIYDLALWLQHIPPENFAFEGVVIGELIDITEDETLSRLKLHLLPKDAIVDSDSVRDLECLIQTYFRLPDLRLGITAIDYPAERRIVHRYKIRFDFLANSQECLLAQENRNSVYEKACKYREVLLIEDLEQVPSKTPVEHDLLAAGIRSILIAPLLNKNERVIGLFEIGSPRPFALNSFVELKFRKLTSLFTLAVERSREEIDNQIEAVIREQFTAIHPSVEWRFVEAAHNLLDERLRDNDLAVIEPIVFHDVYPFYGQCDIVSSSDKRNQAIQEDLIENLTRVRKIIGLCLEQVRFPLLHQFLVAVEKELEEWNGEFSSSDESRIVDLLQLEVHPLLRHLRNSQPDLAVIISGYFDSLDPDLQIVYRKRKAYEESVVIINNTIAGYLEQQQRDMQRTTPHYFEKYKTDGVEYDIYAGKSLLRQGEFCTTDLRNLRLWQLIHMCEITRKVHQLYDSLPLPLTTAQLIFAYTSPLSIRFRMDEKQFDVDGAYNVRYEILKKRIDKAIIEGTGERLTAAGKIAIVYLQEKDRQEYLSYFDYLRHENYLDGEVEDLPISRLQSVQGLRALRITVRL